MLNPALQAVRQQKCSVEFPHSARNNRSLNSLVFHWGGFAQTNSPLKRPKSQRSELMRFGANFLILEKRATLLLPNKATPQKYVEYHRMIFKQLKEGDHSTSNC